jgi:hypothetical protein
MPCRRFQALGSHERVAAGWQEIRHFVTFVNFSSGATSVFAVLAIP